MVLMEHWMCSILFSDYHKLSSVWHFDSYFKLTKERVLKWHMATYSSRQLVCIMVPTSTSTTQQVLANAPHCDLPHQHNPLIQELLQNFFDVHQQWPQLWCAAVSQGRSVLWVLVQGDRCSPQWVLRNDMWMLTIWLWLTLVSSN